MRPVPLDDEDWGDSYNKLIVSAPSGDMTDDDCRAVEAIVGPVMFNGQIAPAFHIKIRLEPEDLYKIQHGRTDFWLILYGARMQPFAIEFRESND